MDNLLTKVKTNNRILNQQSRLGQETEMKKILKNLHPVVVYIIYRMDLMNNYIWKKD